MKLQINDEGVTIELEKIEKINTLKEQMSVFTNALELAQPITLEAQDVTEIDTPSVQLILSFLLAAKEKGISFKWQEISATVESTVTHLGLAPLLNFKKNKRG
jgi:anti-anti-sigma regulatory factor